MSEHERASEEQPGRSNNCGDENLPWSPKPRKGRHSCSSGANGKHEEDEIHGEYFGHDA